MGFCRQLIKLEHDSWWEPLVGQLIQPLVYLYVDATTLDSLFRNLTVVSPATGNCIRPSIAPYTRRFVV